MKPRSAVSGVRSSWLALATKSERMRSIISCSVSSRRPISAAAWRRRRTGTTRTPKARGGGPGSWIVSCASPWSSSASSTAASSPGSRRLASIGLADRLMAEQRRRGLVGADHAALAADQQQRIGQRVEQRRQQAIGLGAALALLGQRAVEAMQRGRQLLAAERAELLRRLGLAPLGQRREVAPGGFEAALPQPGQRAAQHQRQQPGEQRRRPAETGERHQAEPARTLAGSASQMLRSRSRCGRISRSSGWPGSCHDSDRREARKGRRRAPAQKRAGRISQARPGP